MVERADLQAKFGFKAHRDMLRQVLEIRITRTRRDKPQIELARVACSQLTAEVCSPSQRRWLELFIASAYRPAECPKPF